MKTRYLIDDLWPISTRSLTKTLLRSLDEVTYKKLLDLIFDREVRFSRSQKHARELVRAVNRRRNPYRHDHRPPEFLIAKCKSSLILESFCPDRKAKWLETRKRTKNIHIDLENFSLIDAPEHTFVCLKKIAEAETNCSSVQINFIDKNMLDIGPYLIWGLMREHMAPCITGGSIHDGVRTAIDATGLRHFLRIGSYGRRSANNSIVAFKLRRRRSSGTSTSSNIAFEPSTKEKVNDDLTNAINLWLKHAKRTLTDYGRNQLYQLSGELLDNAERHARQEGDGEWSVAGLMDRRTIQTKGASKAIFVCNFAFLSLGLLISETILNAADASTLKDVNKYCEIHGGLHSGDRRNLLATIFALQDGVSHVSQKDREKGGVGMMTAVDAVVGLSESAEDGTLTAVSIISGASCIKLTYPFLHPHEKGALRYQWFNEVQSPETAPSKVNTFSLPASFPGTIISCRFVLNDVTQEIQPVNA